MECAPCNHVGPALALSGDALAERQRALGDAWRTVDDHHLERTFRFPDFLGALAFANVIGELAERQGHHPVLHVSWGKVRVEIWTHASHGLTDADFFLASGIDRLPPGEARTRA